MYSIKLKKKVYWSDYNGVFKLYRLEQMCKIGVSGTELRRKETKKKPADNYCSKLIVFNEDQLLADWDLLRVIY